VDTFFDGLEYIFEATLALLGMAFGVIVMCTVVIVAYEIAKSIVHAIQWAL